MQEAAPSRQAPDKRGGNDAASPTRRRSNRRIGYAVSALLGLSVLTWITPAIVARPWIIRSIAVWLVPQLDGKIDLRTASLGWFSPIEFSDVVLRGVDGTEMLRIEKVSSRGSLLRLVTNPRHFRGYQLTKPRFRLVLRPDGSNLEDALSRWIGDLPADAPESCFDVECDVVGGSIEFLDDVGRPPATITDVTMSLRLPRSRTDALRLTASGEASEGGESGDFAVNFSYRRPQGGHDESPPVGQLAMTCDGLPLPWMEPLVTRLTSSRQVALSGHLSSNLRIVWEQINGRRSTLVSGTASARRLACAASTFAADEQVCADHVDIAARVSWVGNELHVEQFDVESDLGNVKASGSAAWDWTAMGRWRVPLQPLPGTDDFHVDAQLDLARWSASAFKALHMRDDAKVTAGQVQVNLVGRRGDTGAAWSGSLETSDLEGFHNGQIIRWEHPPRISVTIRDSDQEVVVEELSCESEFLRVAGRGCRDHGQLTATGDLTRLMAEVDRFVDLHHVELAGQLHSNLTWIRGQSDEVDANADLVVENFLVRLEPFCSAENWLAAGQIRLDAELDWTARQLDVKRSRLELLQFDASNGTGLVIDEPLVRIEGTGNWNIATQRLYSAEATLTSSSLALRTQHLHFGLADNTVAGKIGFRGDVARLCRWMHDADGNPKSYVEGDVSGWIVVSRPIANDESQLGNERASELATATSPAPSRSAAQGAEIAAHGSLGWSSMNVFGVSIDPSTIKAQLSNGVVRMTPLSSRMAEGQLTTSPRLDLRAQPCTVVLDAGPLVDDVRISPEMCHGWLKYVAPIVADATSAQGRFSVTLNGAKLPVAQPEQSEASGVLTVHSAQVLPGPLAKPMLSIAHDVASLLKHKSLATKLLDPAGAWLELDQQRVEFQMVNGRVYHRGLEMRMKDVIIRTHGWVALDQTVSILAEIPIRDEWIRGDRILNSLRGTSIQIPIRGTINRPQVDGSALAQLTQNLIGDAAGQLLEDELHKQLQRLLPIR